MQVTAQHQAARLGPPRNSQGKATNNFIQNFVGIEVRSTFFVGIVSSIGRCNEYGANFFTRSALVCVLPKSLVLV